MQHIATLRIGITDPQLVWDRATDSFLNDGNNPDDLVERFGTRDEPRLAQCVTEICAEADHGGLFEFHD